MGVELYISPLKNIRNLELSISQFGDAELASGWRNTVCNPYNRLYLIESGSMSLRMGDRKVDMLPGMIYLIPAGLAADVLCNTNMKNLYFHFNLFRFGRNDVFYGVNTVMETEADPTLIDELRTHGKGRSMRDSMLIKTLLYQLLTTFLDKYGFSQVSIPVYSDLITKAIIYIQNNLSANLSLDVLAEHCHVSRSLLSKEFCKEMGMPIGKYIDSQLLLIAQWELRHTSENVKEISRMLGYSDPCYFSRRFKQMCGKSPMQCRKETAL